MFSNKFGKRIMQVSDTIQCRCSQKKSQLSLENSHLCTTILMDSTARCMASSLPKSAGALGDSCLW